MPKYAFLKAGRERIETEPECLDSNSQVSRLTDYIDIQTGPCNLKDARGYIVALGEVVGITENSTLHKLNFLCKLDEIRVPSAIVFETNGMLCDYFVGEVIPWPAFFVTYL